MAAPVVAVHCLGSTPRGTEAGRLAKTLFSWNSGCLHCGLSENGLVQAHTLKLVAQLRGPQGPQAGAGAGEGGEQEQESRSRRAGAGEQEQKSRSRRAGAGEQQESGSRRAGEQESRSAGSRSAGASAGAGAGAQEQEQEQERRSRSRSAGAGAGAQEQEQERRSRSRSAGAEIRVWTTYRRTYELALFARRPLRYGIARSDQQQCGGLASEA